MLSNSQRLVVALFFGLTLVISACGGGDSTASTGTDDTAADDATSNDEAVVDEGTGDGDVEVTNEDVAVDTIEPVDLSGEVDDESISSLVLALTGSEPADTELACLSDIAENDTQLTEVFNGFGTATYELTPEGFTALAVNTHECVDNSTLAGSLAGLSILEGEGATTFEACISERIDDETNGDLAYTGLSALLVGFEIPEGSAQAAFDSVIVCVTPEDLAEQVAFNTESNLAFTVEVDRDCIIEELDEEVTAAFWSTFILGEGDGSEVGDLVDSCTESFDSGLPQELPEDFVPFAASGALAGIDPFARNGVYTAAPDLLLEDGVDYQAVLTTADGDIVIDLYEDTAPLTVNSFVALARDGYFDGTVFHRVLEGFMAQAGDPTGTGTGGPGYSFDDEESAMTEIDRRGLLAMANSGPNTNGSQFFITFEPADFLNGLHAVFGEVIEGDDVLAAVDLRNPEAPTSRGESLLTVTITES